ncbi:MAG: hypothetical protein MRK02_02305 [Candidatus Scalindua sp.]|nr:hypothetical protein [Candidatus Scalindua sp.]
MLNNPQNNKGENNQEPAQNGDGAQSLTPAINLPKGGGAIRGIDEKFSVNPATGTGSMSIPIATSPGRQGFSPQLALSYDSSAGNGPFGLGWNLSIPSITRKTDKGIPRYEDAVDSDTFILSGAEDLVPVLILIHQEDSDTWEKDVFPRTRDDVPYTVQRYRPRIEGLFARIEKWTNRTSGIAHWESTTKDNVKSVYGKSANSRISASHDDSRIFKWLLEESHDDKGNVIFYTYKQEDTGNIEPSWPQEKNRLANNTSYANRYLKRIKYGNETPFQQGEDLSTRDDWLFEVVFDYGEHDLDVPTPDDDAQTWLDRPDAFSSFRAGFEIRTQRLCRRVLMFHHFPELGDTPCLVRSTDLTYEENPVGTYLIAARQTGYIRLSDEEGYQKKSLPPVEFTYTRPEIDEEVRMIDEESIADLPAGLGGGRYQWVDLDGEGISGVVKEHDESWFYKSNLGNFKFDPATLFNKQHPPDPPDYGEHDFSRFSSARLVATIPSLADIEGGQQQFMDLAGDGTQDLVLLSEPVTGYYERGEAGGWDHLAPFSSSPKVTWNDPNLRFVDLNGDGHADLLITHNDLFVWHPSLAEEGFGPAEMVSKVTDEEHGPALVFADRTQSIYLADMTGDGLTDLVRISNGEVCYWPNHGYGHFGAKVTMDHPPHFDHPDYFDQGRIRLADIDGSGTSDIIYLGRGEINLWANQAGNSWSSPQRLTRFPAVDNISSVTVVDLTGNGTACLVWSSPLPGDAYQPMRYIDLMGGKKPHLLISVKNNMGAETTLHYAPSTKFYLEDKAAGTPWITKVPFPVHVVEKAEVFDHISKTKLVSLYRYHHGYFDGEEREFRGFGMVEQWDTEYFDQFTSSDDGTTDTEAEESFHLPPVYTKTWFHTGAYIQGGKISQQYEEEYYQGDPQATLLPDTILPAGLTAQEQHEASRSLKGSVLRQEIYAVDDSARREHPYTVSESAYKLEMLQPMQDGHYAVFYAYPCEALNYHYERNPEDPRINHSMTLEVDNFGNVVKSAAIGYPRRILEFTEQQEFPEQEKTYITYTENRVRNKPDEDEWYRIGVPVEVKTYEITGLTAGNDPVLELEEVTRVLAEAAEIHYEAEPDSNSTQKRLIEQSRTLYLVNDLSNPLPLGEVESLALPFKIYTLAFTPGLLEQVYNGKFANNEERDETLRETGRYVSGSDLKVEGLFSAEDTDDIWWLGTGRPFFSPDPNNPDPQFARDHFFLVQGAEDPFGNVSTVIYDDHNLLVVETRNALGNTTNATNDYRILQTKRTIGPNRNRSQVAFDILGMVVGTAVRGKDDGEGDSLDVFEADLDDDTITSHIEDPFANAHTILGDATTRMIYDVERFQREGRPNVVCTLTRETHLSDLEPGEQTKIQHSFLYSDGFGREIMTKIQAEPGPTPARDPDTGELNIVDGEVQMTETDTDPRWVGTGRTIYNNKGKPVKQYEPFFSDTHRYEDERELVHWGVTPLLFYDPLARVVATLHPNHTYEKVVFDPWKQTSWDVNDTLHPEQRFDPQSPDVLPDHTFNPVNDPDVGHYFLALPEEEHLPTWYNLRIDETNALEEWPDPVDREAEVSAARKAAKHAATPIIAHMDTLGRTFLTIADNGNAEDGAEQRYETRVRMDIEGNLLVTTDARGNDVETNIFNVLGEKIFTHGMDSGDRWLLTNVAGNPIFSWDSREHRFRSHYNELQRPVATYVRQGEETEQLVTLILYGERHPQAEALNLRGQVFQIYDQAGVITNVGRNPETGVDEAFDFKGNPLRSTRRMAQDYKNTVDWSVMEAFLTVETLDLEALEDEATSFLETRTYQSTTRYDALNRPVELQTPDGSLHRPAYNEANFLEQMAVQLRGEGDFVTFVSDIDYNEKGQRTRIEYGNGVITEYTYDKKTFRLTRLLSNRETTPSRLQDLNYTYDPVGNITGIRDSAQQTIDFNNQVVEAFNQYEYDAIYQLIRASGREHVGQNTNNLPQHRPELKPHYDFNGSTRRGLNHPHDGQAMRRYVQNYLYDEVGNIMEMAHNANGGSFTRRYEYAQESNRLLGTNLPGDGEDQFSGRYGYDNHGNMTQMPHLSLMQWDSQDRLHAAQQQVVNSGGTPETTYYVYDASGQRVRKVTERQGSSSVTPTRMNERMYLGSFEVFRRYETDGETVTLERETLHIMDDTSRIALVDTRTVGTDESPEQTIRFQFSNHLGSASIELDENAAIISYEEYHPYGTTSYQAGRNVSEVSLKRYRYTGKEKDEETGLYYHGARYYACWLGRWTAADKMSISIGLNKYKYVENNPVKFVDLDGNKPVTIDTPGFDGDIEKFFGFFTSSYDLVEHREKAKDEINKRSDLSDEHKEKLTKRIDKNFDEFYDRDLPKFATKKARRFKSSLEKIASLDKSDMHFLAASVIIGTRESEEIYLPVRI